MIIKNRKLPIGFTTAGIVALAGGAREVGEACDVVPQSVNKWKYIPSKHARTVAIKAGLPLEIVRPDLVRAQA